MTEVLVTRADITDQITSLNHLAKREFPKVGTVLVPTPWDLRHVRINYLLDELDLWLENDKA